MQVAGYAGLLLATPTVLYQVVAYVLPGLTRSERRLLAPIIFGSSILFYLGCAPAHLPVAESVQHCRGQIGTPHWQQIACLWCSKLAGSHSLCVCVRMRTQAGTASVR